jgi:hypothetical protein
MAGSLNIGRHDLTADGSPHNVDAAESALTAGRAVLNRCVGASTAPRAVGDELLDVIGFCVTGSGTHI